MPSNPVADKLRENAQSNIQTLSTGVRVIIPEMSSFEIQALAMYIPEPRAPLWTDPETGREMENVNDPTYLAAKQASDIERGMLSLDAMLIGVILVDGMPEDDTWLKVLQFKVKKGIVRNMEDYNLDNPLELEFVFKKHHAFRTTSDWQMLQGKIEETQGGAKKADAVFQSDEERAADNGASPEAASEGEASRNNV